MVVGEVLFEADDLIHQRTANMHVVTTHYLLGVVPGHVVFLKAIEFPQLQVLFVHHSTVEVETFGRDVLGHWCDTVHDRLDHALPQATLRHNRL
ncbi:hypothetical protein D3C71_983890 [compost metagenome]